MTYQSVWQVCPIFKLNYWSIVTSQTIQIIITSYNSKHSNDLMDAIDEKKFISWSLKSGLMKSTTNRLKCVKFEILDNCLVRKPWMWSSWICRPLPTISEFKGNSIDTFCPLTRRGPKRITRIESLILFSGSQFRMWLPVMSRNWSFWKPSTIISNCLSSRSQSLITNFVNCWP